MIMKTTLIAFVAVIVTMAIIDGAWLATMSKSFYGVQLKHLMAARPNLLPAIIFYLIYAIALGSLSKRTFTTSIPFRLMLISTARHFTQIEAGRE